jgi:hypothetical protein
MQCCASERFIPDPGSEFLHPGSWIHGQISSGFRISIRIKVFSKKIVFKLPEI